MKEEFNERRRNQKNNKNSLASTLLLIVSILIFCTCLFILVRWYINTSSSKKKYDDLANDVVKNIDDNGKCTIYGLVFRNSMLINERVNAAVDAYKNHRIKKIIFSGGNKGISSQENDVIPEAIKNIRKNIL